MAKADEAPQIEYRIGDGAKWALLGISLLLDAIVWTIALAGIALTIMGIVPGAAIITWPLGLAISSAGGIVSFAGSVILFLIFLLLGVSAFTRKFSRVVIKMFAKIIPGLSFFAVFLFPNTLQTWSTIRISRLEDKYKWLRVAERLFAARVALSNKELNARAWSKLSAAEQQLLESSGLNLNNIEQTSFGRDLIEEAKKQKIGAVDLPRTLRGAKTEAELAKGLSVSGTGARLPAKDAGAGLAGAAVIQKGNQPVDGKIRSREETLIAKADELSPEELAQLQDYINQLNKSNRAQIELEKLSDVEKRKLYEKSLEGVRDGDLLEDEKRDKERLGDEIPPDEPFDEDGVQDNVRDGIFVSDGEEDEILRYAKDLEDDDYREALEEAKRRDESGESPPIDFGTIGDEPVTPAGIQNLKERALKQALRGKNIEEVLANERVEPEALRKRLESDLVSAERVLKQRAKSLERLKDSQVQKKLGFDDAPEPDYGSLIVALRDKNTSNGHARMIMHLKSREFENVLRTVDRGAQDHARDIRYGNWLERTLENQATDQLIRQASEAVNASIKAGKSASGQAFEESEEDFKRLLNDDEIGLTAKRALADAHMRELEQLRQQGFAEVDAWLKDAIAVGELEEEEIGKVLKKVKATREELIQNPATPESKRRELQATLDTIDKEFGKYLKDKGFEEVQ